MPLQAIALALLLLPAAGALGLALGAFSVPRTAVKLIGPGVVWLGFLATLLLPADLLVDRLSIFMSLVVTGVGGLIVTYAVGYMDHEGDASYARFFCYMDLFIFSMLLLVLAGNFVFLIMGWAMVALSSYLLIGFYYWRHSAGVAARKAFVMNVIGDIGLILAALAIFAQFGQMTFAGVFAA